MFRVEYHYQGHGLWSRGEAPMTQLVAASHAHTHREIGFADETRLVTAGPVEAVPGSALDLRI